jgi:hypothetical protein
MPFFPYKNRTIKKNRSCLGIEYQCEWEDIRKGGWKANMVEIFCTNVSIWKDKMC